MLTKHKVRSVSATDSVGLERDLGILSTVFEHLRL